MLTDVFPIGSFSIFTNNDLHDSNPDDLFVKLVSYAIVSHFKDCLAEFPDLKNIVITDVKTERGCIITTLTLGAIITGAGGGIYVFVKDYDKLRSNLQLIIDDFKNAYLKIRHKKKVPTDIEIEYIKSLPTELKKYHISDHNILDISEEETTKTTKTAVMRDDIIQYIEENTVKSKIITIHIDHGAHGADD